MKMKLIIVLKRQNMEIDKIIQKYQKMKEKNKKEIKKLEEEMIKGGIKCYH